MSTGSSSNLAQALHRHGALRPAATALVVGGIEISYGELRHSAAVLAAHLRRRADAPRVGILGSRSRTACTGILATAWAGGTYVPLNLKLPEARLLALLGQLELDALVVDARGAASLSPAVLSHAPSAIVLADDAPDVPSSAAAEVRRLGSLANDELSAPLPVPHEHLAYIEFTSGTTGVPKGVMVPVGAVQHYLDVMEDWCRLTPDDRAAETCDITFDLSVHNMFLTWRAGAALHVMTPLQMLAPARFIRGAKITSWLSVPSIIGALRQTRTLAPNVFPSLRLSLFCGEPLPLAAARAWAEAAPNSVVENLYGPTEATVACLRQPLTDPPIVTPRREILAIGRAFPGTRVAVLDGARAFLPRGQPGEIALSGRQLALGYYRAPGLTAERFPVIAGTRWYLTGDLGVEDEHGVLHHLGRLDNQVKVLGHRVELEEVEMHLRAASGSDLVAAVAWPSAHGSASGLVGFAAGGTVAGESIRAELRRELPGYMVPSVIHRLDQLPLNSNGKVDRRALLALLEGQQA